MPQQSRLTTIFLILAIVLMTGWLLYAGRGLLTPVVGAILCVFVINGLSAGLARLPRLSRLPAWGRDVISALLICLALVEVVYLAATNIGSLAVRAPEYQASLAQMAQQIAAWVDMDEEQVMVMFQSEATRLFHLPSFVRAVAASALTIAAVLFFVILNIAFLMAERKDFSDKIDRLGLSQPAVQRTRIIIADVNRRVSQYLAVQTMLNIVLGMLSWLIMVIFGLEFAVIFAIIIAVLNYIPYIGSYVGVAFPVVAALVQFDSIMSVVWLAGFLGAAQFLIGNIVSPRVMGHSLNLSPWVILVGLTFWASLWGVAGAVFSVPIMAVLVVILGEFETTRPFAILMSRKGDLGDPGVAVTPLPDKAAPAE